MKLKKILITIVVIMILALSAALIYVYLQNDVVPETQSKVEDVENPIVKDVDNNEEIKKIDNKIVKKELSGEEITREQVIGQATLFVEIVSNRSNHDSYQSLHRADSLISEKVKTEMNSWIDSLKSESGITADYSGVTGKVMMRDIIDFDYNNSQALVALTVQQQLDSEKGYKVQYVEVEVHLTKQAEKWIVDEFEFFDKI